MTNFVIKPKPINKENFKKFGDMITTADIKPIEINEGYAKRFDGIANLGGGGGYAWIIGASLGAVIHLAISNKR